MVTEPLAMSLAHLLSPCSLLRPRVLSRLREPDLVAGELRGGVVYGHSYYSQDMSETNEEFVVVQDAKADDHDFHHDEVEDFDDSNVIQDEILQE
ncbi:hypothetical protein R6Q57_001407 [Mikania cordata]